jgi:hypothetical protein
VAKQLLHAVHGDEHLRAIERLQQEHAGELAGLRAEHATALEQALATATEPDGRRT